MSSGPIDIQIGDGRNPCTKDVRFHICNLRNVDKKVAFVDTMGLDDSADLNNNSGQKNSEDNIGDMYHTLKGIKNILVVLYV